MTHRIAEECDILIVGGGPAGISAAISAARDPTARIVLIDDNDGPGGQIWKKDLSKSVPRPLSVFQDLIKKGRIDFLPFSSAAAQTGKQRLLAVSGQGAFEIGYRKLIIAAGARELFIPFENWTVPQVFGAGGLQALVKGGLPVDGKRVVVSGSGPLLLAVAEYLAGEGARIVTVVEQVPWRRLLRMGPSLSYVPSKFLQAVKLKTALSGVRLVTGSYVRSAEGTDTLRAVTISGKISERIECDMLACGFHLVPNTELAELLGCAIGNGRVVVDEFQRTSLENVFSAGESCGVGGVELAMAEGAIAGLAAVGLEKDAARLAFRRWRYRRFASALERCFAPSEVLKTIATDSSVLCRCEDVFVGKAKRFKTFREAKLQTRCGMGQCQGRICGPAAGFLFGWERNAVRPPVYPVRIGSLVE